MKAYTVVGYAHEGALYCPEHKPDGAEDSPLFVSDCQEGDACDVPECGYLDGCEPEEPYNPEAE